MREFWVIFYFLIYTIYALERSKHYFKGQEKNDLLEFITPRHDR